MTFISKLKKVNKDNRAWFLSMAKRYDTAESWEHSRLKQFIAAKNFNSYETAKKKTYLVQRINKHFDEDLQKQIERVESLKNAGTVKHIQITVEWKKSATWGMCPRVTADITISKNDGESHTYERFEGYASGCGYDKESTAIASALNQCDAFIALLFEVEKKDKAKKIYGYSNSEKGYFPHLSGGVGVSCYPAVFAAAGYSWKCTGSGKTFDCYAVTKL